MAPNDADELARAIEELVQDPKRAFEMGRVARERIVTEFSPAAHLAGVHAVYDEATAAVQER